MNAVFAGENRAIRSGLSWRILSEKPDGQTEIVARGLDLVLGAGHLDRTDVAAHELRVIDLFEDVTLQGRLDVAEEEPIGLAIALGKLRLEVLEDVQIGADGLARIEIGGVLSLPVEGFPGRVFEPLQIDPPALESTHLLRTEVVAHDSHHVDVREIRSGQGEIGRRASKDLFGAAGGGFKRVVRDASNYENRHGLLGAFPG